MEAEHRREVQEEVERAQATSTRIIWFIVSALAGVTMLTLTSIIGYEMSQLSQLQQQASERGATLAVVQAKQQSDEQRLVTDETRIDNLQTQLNLLQRSIPVKP